MRTAALKQTTSRRCRTSQVPLFYRPGGVAKLLFHAPLSPLSTQPSSPFSRSPALSVFFPADGCPFLSLSASDSKPIVARGIPRPSPLPSSLPFFSSIRPSISLSHVFVPLLLSVRSPLRLLLSLLRYLSASPPSVTAVPPFPRADATTRCNVTFIVPFSPFPRSLSLSSS